MIDIVQWQRHLRWAEDTRKFPYLDSVNKITVGVGRNLTDVGLSQSEIQLLLDNDCARVLREAQQLPFWNLLSDGRKIVVADMLFNLGLSRFLKFEKMIAALELGLWDQAADEMKNSRWYHQVGRRAVRLVAAMRTGEWTDLPAGNS